MWLSKAEAYMRSIRMAHGCGVRQGHNHTARIRDDSLGASTSSTCSVIAGKLLSPKGTAELPCRETQETGTAERYISQALLKVTADESSRNTKDHSVLFANADPSLQSRLPPASTFPPI